jgi:amidase
MARPELLEPRTRRIMRFGRALGPLVGLAERIERRAAAALDELHRDVDLLLFPGNVKPPGGIGQYAARGALYTLWSDTARVAFQPLWNLVGRPAAMLPAGFDADGLPLSVQLGARPNDEATLVALAAQLESERGWHRYRPPED